VADSPLRILQVNTVDSGGGAAKVARDLFQAYRRRGHGSWMAVGTKLTRAPFVLELDHDPYRRGLPGLLAKVWKPLHRLELRRPGMHSLHRRMLLAVDYRRIKNRLMGFEDFEFPGTAHLLDLIPERPDIVQCHNLHGDYFDLRELVILSQHVPVVLRLPDAWLLSGHCAHSLECERWKIGCGNCPDLTIPPPVRRDATAFNWLQKREIFSKSRLYVAAPSHWLMQKVGQSILAPAVIESRIIPNGVDLSVFKPGDKVVARSSIGIQADTRVILFAAVYPRHNAYKDYSTMRSAIELIAKHHEGRKIIIINLGEERPTEHISQTEIRFVTYQKDPDVVARYYQAADVYIHAARADTFPSTVIESLACGTPVVATAVGGIPEQIVDGETGFLVPPRDAHAMALRIEQILGDEGLRWRMAKSAEEAARRRFDLQRQADVYLSWFEEIRRRKLGSASH
jgi:glycosyltransferase involved in cell wall biosynthesis